MAISEQELRALLETHEEDRRQWNVQGAALRQKIRELERELHVANNRQLEHLKTSSNADGTPGFLRVPSGMELPPSDSGGSSPTVSPGRRTPELSPSARDAAKRELTRLLDELKLKHVELDEKEQLMAELEQQLRDALAENSNAARQLQGVLDRLRTATQLLEQQEQEMDRLFHAALQLRHAADLAADSAESAHRDAWDHAAADHKAEMQTLQSTMSQLRTVQQGLAAVTSGAAASSTFAAELAQAQQERRELQRQLDQQREQHRARSAEEAEQLRLRHAEEVGRLLQTRGQLEAEVAALRAQLASATVTNTTATASGTEREREAQRQLVDSRGELALLRQQKEFELQAVTRQAVQREEDLKQEARRQLERANAAIEETARMQRQLAAVTQSKEEELRESARQWQARLDNVSMQLKTCEQAKVRVERELEEASRQVATLERELARSRSQAAVALSPEQVARMSQLEHECRQLAHQNSLLHETIRHAEAEQQRLRLEQTSRDAQHERLWEEAQQGVQRLTTELQSMHGRAERDARDRATAEAAAESVARAMQSLEQQVAALKEELQRAEDLQDRYERQVRGLTIEVERARAAATDSDRSAPIGGESGAEQQWRRRVNELEEQLAKERTERQMRQVEWEGKLQAALDSADEREDSIVSVLSKRLLEEKELRAADQHELNLQIEALRRRLHEQEEEAHDQLLRNQAAWHATQRATEQAELGQLRDAALRVQELEHNLAQAQRDMAMAHGRIDDLNRSRLASEVAVVDQKAHEAALECEVLALREAVAGFEREVPSLREARQRGDLQLRAVEAERDALRQQLDSRMQEQLDQLFSSSGGACGSLLDSSGELSAELAEEQQRQRERIQDLLERTRDATTCQQLRDLQKSVELYQIEVARAFERGRDAGREEAQATHQSSGEQTPNKEATKQGSKAETCDWGTSTDDGEFVSASTMTEPPTVLEEPCQTDPMVSADTRDMSAQTEPDRRQQQMQQDLQDAATALATLHQRASEQEQELARQEERWRQARAEHELALSRKQQVHSPGPMSRDPSPPHSLTNSPLSTPRGWGSNGGEPPVTIQYVQQRAKSPSPLRRGTEPPEQQPQHGVRFFNSRATQTVASFPAPILRNIGAQTETSATFGERPRSGHPDVPPLYFKAEGHGPGTGTSLSQGMMAQAQHTQTSSSRKRSGSNASNASGLYFDAASAGSSAATAADYRGSLSTFAPIQQRSEGVDLRGRPKGEAPPYSGPSVTAPSPLQAQPAPVWPPPPWGLRAVTPTKPRAEFTRVSPRATPSPSGMQHQQLRGR